MGEMNFDQEAVVKALDGAVQEVPPAATKTRRTPPATRYRSRRLSSPYCSSGLRR